MSSAPSLPDRLNTCESLLTHTFSTKPLCLEALQTSGTPILWEGKTQLIPKNDRLAILGETLMRTYLCKRWIGSGRTKGEWSTAEQATLGHRNLARIGFEKGLDRCVILNAGTGIVSEKGMAGVVQALVGAVWCDGGDEAVERVVGVDGLGVDHEMVRREKE